MTDKTARDLVMGTIYCVIGGICWGISGTTAEYLMAHKGLSADWISVLRMLVGGGAILLYAFSRQGGGIFALWRDPVSVVRVAAFGFLGMNLAQYAYVLAIGASNAGTATMLQYTGPIGVLPRPAVAVRTGKHGHPAGGHRDFPDCHPRVFQQLVPVAGGTFLGPFGGGRPDC